jgi:hypothetical protein
MKICPKSFRPQWSFEKSINDTIFVNIFGLLKKLAMKACAKNGGYQRQIHDRVDGGEGDELESILRISFGRKFTGKA